MPSQILHPTSSWLRAPWFLTKEHVLQLDEIVKSELPRLEQKREELIVSYVEKEISRRVTVHGYSPELAEKRRGEMMNERKGDYKLQTACAILLKYGVQEKQATGEFFDEIVNNPAITNEVPTGLYLKLQQQSTNFEAVVTLNKDGWMKIEASPNGDVDAQRIYMRLLDWAKRSRPSWWYQHILPIAALLAFAALSVSLLLTALQAINVQENSVQAGRRQYIAEAHKLLDTGVNPQNESQAIQLLLSLESSYQGASPSSLRGSYLIQSPWNLVFFFLGLFTFMPRLIIGVGAAERRLVLWTNILRISYSLPLWILAVLFSDPIKDFVRRYFLSSP